MDLPAIGHRIRQARLALGLTQAQVAESAGLSRSTIIQIESGIVSDLGVRKVITILACLGLSLTVENRRATGRADYLRMAATAASVGFATHLTESEIRHLLVTGTMPKTKKPQVRRLMEEAPAELVRGLLRQVGSTNKPGRVEANVRRIAAGLGIPTTRVDRWLTNA